MNEQRMEQVSPTNIVENFNVLNPMLGGEVSYEEWEIILAEIGNDSDLMTKLHDYLYDKGQEVQTAEQLRSVVNQLKQK